jgi:membrane-associated protease RseP (regulator of RpoE activity)
MFQFNYNLSYFVAYEDSPAFRSNLTGAIKSIDNHTIYRLEDIISSIQEHKPNDVINIETTTANYSIVLEDYKGKAYLGIAFPRVKGIAYFWSRLISPYFYPYLNVQPRFNKDILDFIKYFFFWAILINISVALFNMMPFGIFDGGRMAFIGFSILTKSKKKSLLFYRLLSSFVIFILILLMLVWMIKI